MIDQLRIGDLASFDDFGASISQRRIGSPVKKSIKETVPFSNITYDFTAINGEIYWEERELEYTFEITAPSPEQLEEMKTAFSNWVMNIIEQDIHDPFIPDYHFKGTFDDIEFSDEDSIEKTTVTVVFLAYPYKIANVPKVYRCERGAKLTIINDSNHRISPVIDASTTCEITKNGVIYRFAGKTKSDSFMLDPGLNELAIIVMYGGTVEISFNEEVF